MWLCVIRYIAKLLQLAARGAQVSATSQVQMQQQAVAQRQQQAQLAQAQQVDMEQQRQQHELAATEAGLAATRGDHPHGHPALHALEARHTPVPSRPLQDCRKAFLSDLRVLSGQVAMHAGHHQKQSFHSNARNVGGRIAGSARTDRTDLEDYEEQLRRLDEDDTMPSP